MGPFAQAVRNTVSELRLSRALHRPRFPRTVVSPEHCQVNAGSTGARDWMVRALFNWNHFRRCPTCDVRPELGTLAVFASCPLHRDRDGHGAVIRSAAGIGSRDRVLEDTYPCLQLCE